MRGFETNLEAHERKRNFSIWGGDYLRDDPELLMSIDS